MLLSKEVVVKIIAIVIHLRLLLYYPQLSVLETFLASRYFVIILICFPDSYHDPNNVEIEIKLSARCPTSLSSLLPPEQFIIGTRISCLS